MTTAGNPISPGLIARVQNILLKPTTEWDAIEGEPATIQSLFVGYAAPLAAIPVIAGLVGGLLTALLFHGNMLAAAIDGIVGAVLDYAIGLGAVFVLGFVINALATSFDAKQDQIQAMKVAVYSGTARWVSGVFLIIPFLGGLIYWAGAIYSLVLIFFGVSKLMKPPADKSAVYSIVALAIYIGLLIVGFIILGITTAAILLATGGAMAVH
jgi:hypothetical protein